MTHAPSTSFSLPEALVMFARRLRAAGVRLGTEGVLAYGRAVRALGPRTVEDLYWAGRLSLVSSRDDLPVYDQVFAECFGEDAPDAPPPCERDRQVRSEGVRSRGRLISVEDRQEPGTDAGDESFAAASPLEILRQRSFEEYTEEEHARSRALVERLIAREARRSFRRTRLSRRRGRRLDLSRMLRRSLRAEGEPLEPWWRRRRTRPRRAVMLLDVSGSMGAYARPLAQFAHAAVLAGHGMEVFAFGTQLTRLTPVLRSRDRNAVLTALGREVLDWQGGTRIGESLTELVDQCGRRRVLRGAIVVIVSDGLERGDPSLLAAAMERLGRLAYRVVWVNPLKGSPDYRPLARGMAAALPYVDAFLPGHNLASLESLAELLLKPVRER